MKLNGIMRLRIVLAGLLFLFFAGVAVTALFQQHEMLSEAERSAVEHSSAEKLACESQFVELSDLDALDKNQMLSAIQAALEAASNDPTAENPLSIELRGPVSVVGPDGTPHNFPSHTPFATITNTLVPVFDRSCDRAKVLVAMSERRLESEKEKFKFATWIATVIAVLPVAVWWIIGSAIGWVYRGFKQSRANP